MRLDSILITATGSGLLTPRPAVFFGNGIERGVVASVMSGERWSASVGLTDAWAGGGLERKLGRAGLFFGIGQGRADGKVSARGAITIGW